MPYLLSKGYTFKNKLLPRLHVLSHLKKVYITPPIGELKEFADHLIHYCSTCVAAPGIYSLALIGHGTKKDRSNRVALLNLVNYCRNQPLFAAVEAFYLEEKPFVHEIDRFFGPNLTLVVPIFFSEGAHLYDDIPNVLGAKYLHITAPVCHLLDHQVIIDGARTLAMPLNSF